MTDGKIASQWFRELKNTSVTNYSRDAVIHRVSKPAKANGQFITMPGGYKFRRATIRNQHERWIEPGSAMHCNDRLWDTSAKKWVPYQYSSGPGGYNYNVIGDSQFYNAYRFPDVGLNTMHNNPYVPNDARNEAVVKALNDLADGKANVGENLGTMGQTLRMLKNPITSLAKGLYSVYNNRSLRPFIRESLSSLRKKGVSSAAAEKYLEYVYGWKPLLQDIHGIIEVAKEKGEMPLLLHGTATAKREFGYKPFEYSDGASMKTAIVGGNAKAKIRCSLYARIDPDWNGLRTLNQLGLANPLALAWELASFSFVVDWVVPIGPVLNALSAPSGLIFVNGSISNRLSVTSQYENWRMRSDVNISKANGKFRYEGYSRSEITSWPKVGFWIDQDPMRGDRPLKALALLVLQLNKLR